MNKSVKIILISIIFLISAILVFFNVDSKGSISITKDSVSPTPAQTVPTPTIIAGLERKKCLPSSTIFLVPKGWFFKEEQNEDATACFITKESIEKEGVFKTGVTANIIKDSSKKTKVKPSEYIYGIVQEAGKQDKASEIITLQTPSPIKGYGRFVYPQPRPGKEKLNMYLLTFANDKTDTIYIISFESPAKDWEANFPIGEQILQQIGINADY